MCVGEEKCSCTYACICVYVSGSLGTKRPVLCNTSQPNQLKFDFNLCVTFLFGLAVCVFVSMLKRGLLCRDMFTFLKL